VDETVGVIEIGEEVTDARGPEIGVIGETDAQDPEINGIGKTAGETGTETEETGTETDGMIEAGTAAVIVTHTGDPYGFQ
jgi:hypothetical protein